MRGIFSNDRRTYHKHGEQLRVQNAGLKTNIEHNELYQALAAHQRADGTGFAIVESNELGRSYTPNELAKESDDNEEDGITPGFSSIQGAEISLQPRKSKVL